MSVDVLQDKIRKRKNPIMLDLTLLPDHIPPQLREGRSDAEAYGLFSRELIGCMKGILPGVRIGDGAVIGAGSVVTHNIPPNVVAVGNPCKPIREVMQGE